jgi:hypothetical protein
VSLLAGADWVVVVDHADSIDAASSRTRILTGAPDTSLADWTVAAENTLWPAGDVGIADIVPVAGASGLTIEDGAESIGATRVGIARILGLRQGWRNVALSLAKEERVSSVAWWAVADGIVIFDIAVGIDTARSWAGVLTTLANTGKIRLAVSLDGTLRPATLWRRCVTNHARKT